MYKNYLKIAWRSLLRNKSLFSLNVVGLAIGIASCLLIMLFVLDELSYDTYNEKADQIARVVFRAKVNGELIKEAVVMAPVAATLKSEFPEVEDATRLRDMGAVKVSIGKNTYRGDKIAFVDPNFFEVFSIPVLKGNRSSLLTEPNTVVITRNIAHKYFGEGDPVGQILEFNDNGEDYVISGVVDNVPKNSYFHFDIFASMVGHPPAQNLSWMESNFFNYVVLKKGYDLKEVEAKLPAVVEKYMSPQIKESMGISYSDFTKKNQVGLFLQPLTDIHLASDFSAYSELEQGGDITYVYIFSAVAIFMLLIACINFMNLSTAAASKRAKEVGIRKVLGTKWNQLVQQFLTEAFLTTVLAMVLAMALVMVLLPFFNDLAQKELYVGQLVAPKILLALFALTILISFLAGGYPAFFLSSFRPLEALQSKFSGGGKSMGVRSGLVVFQFVISAGLILATLIVDQQMNFIQNKNLGYDKDGLLVLRDAYLMNNDQEAFKNALLQDPRIENVTTSAFLPAGDTDNGMFGVYVGKEGSSAVRRMSIYNIDDRYLPTMGMQLLAGRNFSDQYGSDSLNVIVNETAARILGYGQDAVGRTLTRSLDNFGKKQELTIVGVVKDFHFRSLHQRIEPLVMLNNPYGGLIIRSKSIHMAGLIKDINGIWDRFSASEPFGYVLLDESYKSTYVSEERMGDILRIFALLTILVACLGLFGLVTFTVQQRFKEIGIRKVLGSSVPEIVALLSKDFIRLVFISFLIAFPLGYYVMDIWLQDFAYGIQIQWWVFALTGGITLLIAFFTISFKSVRAAFMNPVESLRTE